MLVRRAVLVAVLVCLTVVLPAALAAPSVKVSVVADEGARVVLDFELLDYRLERVTIDGRPHVIPLLAGEASELEEGAPALPHVTRSLAVPGAGAWRASVLSASFHDLAERVAPSKGNLSRAVDPASVPYRFGAAYERPGFHPGPLAGAGETYVLRDLHGLPVTFRPFQYDAATGTLRVVTRMRVEFAAASPLQVLARPRRPVRAFEALYRARFLNYAPAQRYPALDESGVMLVIAHDAFIPNLDPLVAHKAGIGLTVDVVGVSSIGNSATAIKDYIADYYATHDLAFVLLAGDAAQVATNARQVGGESGACDACYGKLAGADHYPDVLVGRFSASSAAQVDTMVARTIDYESLPATGQAWYRRGTGIASAEGAGAGDEGQSDIQHQDEIRGWLLGAGYTLVDRIYDPGATDTQVTTALNDGRGIVNYTGHGSPTSWGTTGFNSSDVDALANAGRLPFVFAVACNNGEFHHYDACFGEAWLRSTGAGGEPTGAVAAYMSSVSQSWAPPMEAQDEFNLLVTDPATPYQTIGGLACAGSASMMDAYGSGGVEMSDTWILFGDPSLQVLGAPEPAHGLKVTPPEGYTAAGDVGRMPAPESRVYTLQNLDAADLQYEVATDAAWLTVSPPSGIIPASGSVTVTVALHTDAANLDIGTHAGTITFTNLTDHTGDTSRPARADVSGAISARSEGLDADPGWARQGEWEFGRPTGQGGGVAGNPDPASGYTGTNVFGTNLRGNLSPALGGPYYLTAGPFDLSAVSGASLHFRRWLNIAGAPYVSATLQASNDGVGWTTLWEAPPQLTDASWQAVAYDVAALADGRPAVWFRWGYHVLRPLAVTTSGWNIDDVEIRGAPDSACVRLQVEPSRVTWLPLGGVAAYDVVKGDAGALVATGGDFTAATTGCVADDIEATEVPFADEPAEGGALFVLVRGAGPGSALTFGDVAPGQVAPRDAEIDAAPHACP